VSKEDDYRRNAADTLDLARRAPTSADKARLIGLAEAWLNLAERVQRTTSEQVRKLQTLLRT
jgi:hypothetical protein